MSALEVTLRHGFSGFTLDVAFDAPPGLTVLFGRSGSGKTTIINAVAGLFEPQAGRICAGDSVLLDSGSKLFLPPYKRGLGYIFQEGRLFPHLTVQQNLSYGRWFAKGRALPAPDHVIEMLGLGPLLARRPAGLSGGEKQRVAIGRALLAGPRLILADEPLAALDDARKAEILPYFERLRDEVQVPILYVSHSATEVARLATTVIALQDGRVARQGPAVEVLGDASVTPLGAREAGALLSATVTRHHPDGLTELSAGGHPLFLPLLPQPPGSAVRVRVAAHDVILSRDAPVGLSALNIVPARVADLRPGGGPGTLITLDTQAGRVLARVTRRSAAALGLEPGVSCYAVIKAVSVAPGDIGAGSNP